MYEHVVAVTIISSPYSHIRILCPSIKALHTAIGVGSASSYVSTESFIEKGIASSVEKSC